MGGSGVAYGSSRALDSQFSINIANSRLAIVALSNLALRSSSATISTKRVRNEKLRSFKREKSNQEA